LQKPPKSNFLWKNGNKSYDAKLRPLQNIANYIE